MIALREELLNEGVLTLDGIRWSDGYAWCELRPTNDLRERASLIRYLWASQCCKGYGTALLNKVVRAADRLQTTLYLEVEPFSKKKDGAGWSFGTIREGGMNQAQLKAWYERHGFEALEGNVMIRRAPNGSSTAVSQGNQG